jgi:rhodanese-related sulfurtransferase
MKYGLAFLVLGATCAVNAWMADPWWLKALLVNLALCWMGVGLGFLWIGPRVFLKRPVGSLPPISWLVFWPYYLLNEALLLALALTGKEEPAHEVAPGLFLGRQLIGCDRRMADQHRFAAVLDLTSEFQEAPFLRRAPHYKCIPLLDTFAPTAGQLADGVAFITQHAPEGPVFVHCALGHGRSATFAAGYLVAAGIAADPRAAEAMVREKRPGIELHPGQRKALEAYASQL